MANCEVLAKCAFLNEIMRGMPQHAELFKELYCRADNGICARYMIHQALGADAVPTDLFPNEIKQADRILKESRQLKKTVY
jgi:hypothetical protein